MVREALSNGSTAGPEAVDEALDAEMRQEASRARAGHDLLGTLGNNAPFVGLLGTVLGVIEAFHLLGEGQNKAAMGNVMSGIAEALVATGVGLFVALPAVVAYNVMQQEGRRHRGQRRASSASSSSRTSSRKRSSRAELAALGEASRAGEASAVDRRRRRDRAHRRSQRDRTDR